MHDLIETLRSVDSLDVQEAALRQRHAGERRQVQDRARLPVRDRRETHSAIVLIAGDYALKIRKPVDLGFLDYSTPERRHEATQSELQLGRRISPSVYLGEWSIRAETTPVLVPSAGSGEPVLAMKALDERQRLDQVVRACHAAVPPRFDEVADSCAAFHGRCPVDRRLDGWGKLESTWDAWAINFRELPEDEVSVPLSAEARRALIDETRTWWSRHEDVLRQRIADGRVRDGHGDLRAEHVYLSDPVALIDPLEFAPHYRFTDVAAEIGFLAMELQELDRPDLAQSLVERYARTTGDTTLTVVLPFFIRYRAIVRAKVEWIRATQLQGTERETAIARSRTLFHLGATQKLL